MRAARLKQGDSRCSVCKDLPSNVKERVFAQCFYQYVYRLFKREANCSALCRWFILK